MQNVFLHLMWGKITYIYNKLSTSPGQSWFHDSNIFLVALLFDRQSIASPGMQERTHLQLTMGRGHSHYQIRGQL